MIVAGGIGLAPLRPVLQAVLAERSRYGDVVLLVGARTPADLLYPDELLRWGADGGVQVGVTVDRPSDDWTGHVGVVPENRCGNGDPDAGGVEVRILRRLPAHPARLRGRTASR